MYTLLPVIILVRAILTTLMGYRLVDCAAEVVVVTILICVRALAALAVAQVAMIRILKPVDGEMVSADKLAALSVFSAPKSEPVSN